MAPSQFLWIMTSPSIKQYMEIDMIFSLIADICTQQLDTEEHVKI